MSSLPTMNGSPSTTESAAIRMRGVCKRFGAATAVDQLDLTIPRGVTLGLLGPNGAGKSTTLRMLMGMTPPSGGQIEVLGGLMPNQAPMLKQRIGYVPESHHIYRWMSVSEVIRFARAMYSNWNDELCGDLLEMFQLAPKKKVKALSKGMLAKLSLLIALAPEPELIVLDEPLSGLDPIARDEFIDGVLQGICNDQRTVIFSSHQLDEINRLADSVAIMHAGRILAHQPIDTLLEEVKRVRAVLRDGCLPESAPEATIWQRVNRREWLLTLRRCEASDLNALRSQKGVESLEVSELSLDNIFKDFIRGAGQE